MRPLQHWLGALGLAVTLSALLPTATTGCVFDAGYCFESSECQDESVDSCTGSGCGVQQVCADGCYHLTADPCRLSIYCKWNITSCEPVQDLCSHQSVATCSTLPYCELKTVCTALQNCEGFDDSECAAHPGCQWQRD
ncbi:MAG TPA: hypothetical protein VGI10_01500 [Polyangiaceae bacterium]